MKVSTKGDSVLCTQWQLERQKVSGGLAISYVRWPVVLFKLLHLQLKNLHKTIIINILDNTVNGDTRSFLNLGMMKPFFYKK